MGTLIRNAYYENQIRSETGHLGGRQHELPLSRPHVRRLAGRFVGVVAMQLSEEEKTKILEK
jgi:hypothetical protein